MMNLVKKANEKSVLMVEKVKGLMLDKKGEGYVDTGLKILIAVVIGALLLAGLYALFNDTVMPTLVNKVKELFDYKG